MTGPSSTDKRVLFVTGATGFVGSHFVAHAHAAGHRVIALRRAGGTEFRVPVPAEVAQREKALGALAAGDFAGVDVVVHLAAAGATARGATWEECFRVNVVETLAMFSAALDAGVKRFVVAGTYAEYGAAGLRFDPIPPEAPLEPTDVYATSKAAASVALSGLCRARKFELSYQRLFSVFGPGQYEENFWPALRKAALAGADFPMTEGRQVRDFIPVGEVAAKLLHECLRADLVAGTPRIKNLASGQPVALRDFAEQWWKKFEAKGQLKFGAVPTRPNEIARYVPQI